MHHMIFGHFSKNQWSMTNRDYIRNLKSQSYKQMPSYGLFTLHGTGNGTGNGKQWVSILCYVLYILHIDRNSDR